MRNPIVNNNNFLKIYTFIWFDLIAIQICVLFFFYHFPLWITIIDTILYNLSFAGLTLGLWYTIKYLGLENQSMFALVVNHLFTAILVLSLWVFSSIYITSFLVDEELYKEFLKSMLPFKFGVGVFYYLSIILFFYLTIYYNSYKQKQIKEIQLQNLVTETQLNLLRTQLNPHFIFNSLNSISSLTLFNPEKAQEMVVKLSTYMRYTLQKDEDRLITLEKEIEYSKLYLDIEKVRFDERLEFDINTASDTLNCKIPVMLLQPLLENAIKHGVYESDEHIQLKLCSLIESGKLTIQIINNFNRSTPRKKGTGSGLKNTKERLHLIYKSEAIIQVKEENNTFTVTITIPVSNHESIT